jgi:AcrR family transcriptional regulator
VRNQPKSQLAAPDKKELILNAAIPVFGKSGFKKTSIEDLADAADISKQGLYLHFSSKEEIFQTAKYSSCLGSHGKRGIPLGQIL